MEVGSGLLQEANYLQACLKRFNIGCNTIGLHSASLAFSHRLLPIPCSPVETTSCGDTALLIEDKMTTQCDIST